LNQDWADLKTRVCQKVLELMGKAAKFYAS
jgi:hypothetical protein